MPARPDRREFLAELVALTPAEGWPLGQIILTSEEASAYLGVAPVTLRQWVRRGKVIRQGRDAYDMGSLLNSLVDDARRGSG